MLTKTRLVSSNLYFLGLQLVRERLRCPNTSLARTRSQYKIMADRLHNSVVALAGCVAQWQNVGLWPANFSCPALDLQLMGDHVCG